jgi:replicative DNA helicase
MLLACAVHKPELLATLDAEMFYQTSAKTVFRQLEDFQSEKRNSMSDPNQLEHDLMLSLPRNVFTEINGALNDLPSVHNWPYWLEIVTDFKRARGLEMLKPAISDASASLITGDKSGLLGIQTKVGVLVSDAGTSNIPSMGETCNQLVNDLEAAWESGGRLKGIGTGLQELNSKMQGYEKAKFYVIAARPGEGKSSLLLQSTHQAAADGVKVLFFSLEMPRAELVGRLASNLSRVPLTRFASQTATDRDFGNFNAAISAIKNLPLVIIDNKSSLSDIMAICHETPGIGMVVVDYLQRVRIPHFRGNRNELVTEISVAMKDAAMVLEVPVLAAAQLNRASEKEGRAPAMSDLRDSGSIEQDADFVMILHPGKDQGMDGLIVKNRSGDKARISLLFRREIFRFEAL